VPDESALRLSGMTLWISVFSVLSVAKPSRR
jgi:hypothetical protein